MTIIEQIKAEIEKQIKDPQEYCYGVSSINKLRELLDFIDTLESEKPINPDDAMKELDEKIALVKQRGTWDGVDVDKYMDEVRGREPVCEELEKELDEFLKDYVFRKLINRNAGLALARHFAEWQSKQDKETIELAEEHAYLAGSVNEREKMMKEAVEGEYDKYPAAIYLSVRLPRMNNGDKVRVIVLPKEEEKTTTKFSEDTESWPLHRPWPLPEPDADDSYYDNNW